MPVVYRAYNSSKGCNPLFAGLHTFFIVSLKTQRAEGCLCLFLYCIGAGL